MNGRIKRTVHVVLTVAFIFSTLSAGAARAADMAALPGLDEGGLADLSLEELMNVEVYSVGKKEQRLADSAAAVAVITNEDIKRSGATNIPEALRLVPGVEVAHIDSNKWAISIRGFNDRFANKLLVLVDGRSVYTPLFAGVYWDVQDLMLEDVDRIEVIRGPGGTLWGANAVNGVINIITKTSSETQGLLATSAVGSELDTSNALRYGGTLGNHGNYRIYGKWFQRDNFETVNDTNGGDGWRQGRSGLRADWATSDADSFTATADIYEGTSDSRITTPLLTPPYLSAPFLERTDVAGGHALTRWTHRFSDTSDTKLQAYYDRTTRNGGEFREDRDTVDLEFQHRIGFRGRHDLVWGAGYRITGDDMRNDFRFAWTPSSRDTQLFSGFVQDEIALVEDKLHLTIGTKLEHNDYTGWEVQPNFRALWKIHENHRLWGAVSRAVRTPSRSEDDIRLNTAVMPVPVAPGLAIPNVISLFGSRSFNSEDLLAYELGYRARLHSTLSLDVATYYNDYDHLRTINLRDPLNPAVCEEGTLATLCNGGNLVTAFDASNFMNGRAYGVEVAADWSPTDFALIRAGYTYMDLDLSLNAGAVGDSLSLTTAGQSPHNQVFAHGFLDLPHNVDLDVVVRWVDRLQSIDVDAYATVDARLAWEPIAGLELALVGQNLTDASHLEFSSSSLVSSEATKVERGVYGVVSWRR